MSDFEFMNRAANEAFDEAVKLLNRAGYHNEKQDINQALEDAVLGLSQYVYYAKMKTDYITTQTPLDMHLTPDFTSCFWFDILTELDLILGRIIVYTDATKDINSKPKIAFFTEKRKIIFDQLQETRKYLDVDRLRKLDEMSENRQAKENYIQKHKGELEALKASKEKSDKNFCAIREELSKLSRINKCPVELDSYGMSCFIATAAYGNTYHPDLDTFRTFRDRDLLTNSIGRFLVGVYYKIGPQLALYVEKKANLKRSLRYFLSKFAKLLRARNIKY